MIDIDYFFNFYIIFREFTLNIMLYSKYEKIITTTNDTILNVWATGR